VVPADEKRVGNQGIVAVRKLRPALLAFAAFCLAFLAHGQEAAQAAMPGAASFALLFTISWNLTPNVVHYDAKLKDGKFDPKEPVVAYWVMHQTDGHREPLTFIERLKGYGFSIRPSGSPNTYNMVIVSVKKKTLRITQQDDGFQITLSIGDCETASLTRAHVQAHKWHFITIGDYVDLTGTDLKTGAECQERVYAQ
jgi:hypothetical protein